jgi:hypothetical protein
MKMIMSAVTVVLALAGVAAPASAGPRGPGIVEQYVVVPGGEEVKYVKWRRYIPRQGEYIADTLPTGSSAWWQQMDRERRGGRR